jgi:hypothetical protein
VAFRLGSEPVVGLDRENFHYRNCLTALPVKRRKMFPTEPYIFRSSPCYFFIWMPPFHTRWRFSFTVQLQDKTELHCQSFESLRTLPVPNPAWLHYFLTFWLYSSNVIPTARSHSQSSGWGFFTRPGFTSKSESELLNWTSSTRESCSPSLPFMGWDCPTLLIAVWLCWLLSSSWKECWKSPPRLKRRDPYSRFVNWPFVPVMISLRLWLRPSYSYIKIRGSRIQY